MSSSAQSGPQSLLAQKKSPLMQLWTNFKHSIFDVLFVVMDKSASQGQDITIVSLLYQSGVDYIQMMQFPFDATILMVWNGGDTLNNIFNFLTNVLNINQLMPGINYNAFLVILYLIIFSIVLVILDIVYVSYSFNRKKFRFTLPLVLLAQIVPLFVTFLFIPVTQFLLNIINCSESETQPGVQVLGYFSDVVCFQGAHLIHVSITMFFTSIFVFISTIVAMTLFQPRMTANSIAARKSSDGQVIFIVNKIICQFFFSFAPFSDTWIYIVLMFFPALWLFHFYHFHQPYYNRQVGKLYRIFSAYYFWTVSMLSISQLAILINFNFEGAMVIWFCGLPFIGMNIAYQSKSNIDNLFSSNMKFKSGEELQAHLMYVLQLINQRKKDQNANMLLVGYIEKHIQTCVEDDCPIKVKKPKKEELLSEMEENCKLLIIQIERMYKQGIKKYPTCTKLHISFAFFYMERLKQNAKAYEEFVMAQKATPSFVDEFIIYRFKKIIKQNLQENKQEENDLIEVIRFDNHVSLCEEAMFYSGKLHKQFWAELSEQTPNLQKLNQTGGKIIEIVNSVKSNYNQVKKINSHAPEIIHNYGVYSMFIGQNMKEGQRCLMLAKKAYYQKKSNGQLLGTDSNQNLLQMDQSSSLVVVNATAFSMGKILSVNGNFVQLSGYLKEEITQKSIQKILPQIMVFYHDQAMNSWLNDSSRLYMKDQGNSYFRKVHEGFIKQKNGFIVPVNYRVEYNIFEQKFFVYFRQQKQFSQNLDLRIYIITDNKGVVKDISALGFSYFKLNKESLYSTERYIDEFGVNFNLDVYNDEGCCMLIPKKTETFQAGSIHEMRTKFNLKQHKDCQQFCVRAERIMMPCNEEEEDQELQENQASKIKDGRKDIGSIYCLEKVDVEKNNNRDIKFEFLDKYGNEILELYEAQELQEDYNSQEDENDPLLELKCPKKKKIMGVLSGLIFTEQQRQKTIHDYGAKIKTYRLTRGELKRVVQEWADTDSDQNQLDQQKAGLTNYEAQRLKNPVYVQKIMSAINSNIDHLEVKILKFLFFFFTASLLTLAVLDYIQVRNQMTTVKGHMLENERYARDIHYINDLLHLVFNVSQESNQIAAYAKNLAFAKQYEITFDPDIYIQITQEDQKQVSVRLNTAMGWIQGDIVNVFEKSTLAYQLAQLYYNYFDSVLPILETFSPQFTATTTPALLFLLGSILLSTLAVILWIYYAIVIDVKCFDIILWFLDIPVPYVCYLLNNCTTYIKNRTPAKELMEKGINFHDKNLYLQDYGTRNLEDDDDKYHEESKTRKIMSARYKKKTLLSRCDCGYVSLFWLVPYTVVFFIISFVALQSQIQYYKFLDHQWGVMARQMLWSNAISCNLRIIVQNGYTPIIPATLALQDKFLNPVGRMGLNTTYSQLFNSDIAQYYQKYVEGNICQFPQFTIQESTKCKSNLQGKLQGGISSFFTYLPTLDRLKHLQIQQIQYNYVNIYIMKLFDAWLLHFTQKLSSIQNQLTIMLAMYILISVLGFSLLWFLYLNKLNMKMNQTMQMLNMIPMRMLPKNKKDVRDFFDWILRESNKHQQ